MNIITSTIQDFFPYYALFLGILIGWVMHYQFTTNK